MSIPVGRLVLSVPEIHVLGIVKAAVEGERLTRHYGSTIGFQGWLNTAVYNGFMSADETVTDKGREAYEIFGLKDMDTGRLTSWDVPVHNLFPVGSRVAFFDDPMCYGSGRLLLAELGDRHGVVTETSKYEVSVSLDPLRKGAKRKKIIVRPQDLRLLPPSSN